MALEWAAAARLVRRTGFGATGTDVDVVVREGADAYVRRVLAADLTKDAGAVRTPVPAFPAPARPPDKSDRDARQQYRKGLKAQDQRLLGWWLQRMTAVQQPFGEKATFAWHAHFATSLKKVKVAAWMAHQNERQRALATGRFATLAYAMLTDAATLRWLDGGQNTVQGPNENLSREFMEIFTLGHADGYTEQDVREGARALTGWTIDRTNGSTRLRPALHDDGTKTLFGRAADYDAKGFCDAVLARPGCNAYVATRMWHHFVSDAPPSAAVLDRLTGALGPAHDLRALFTTMLTDPSFAAAEGTYVIGPVEWLIGAVRALRVSLDDSTLVRRLGTALDGLGQLPFYPPSVGGWPSGTVWLSTAATDLRFRAASLLVPHADLPSLSGSTTARLEAVAHLLGVDTWSARTLSVLKGSAASTEQLVTVALNTPEYLVH